MDDGEIKKKVDIAIAVLFSNDRGLLENNLSEKSITHKLAEYLQSLFIDYNVDCEYNGNIENDNDRKKIYLLKKNLERKGLLKAKEANDTDAEFADRPVFPDIIIHRRGTNKFNLCIIEVKKSTSNISFDYDEIKLKAYTTEDYGNNLKYKIGIFIEFVAGTTEIDGHIKYYINGEKQ